MKKSLILILIAALVFGFCACGKDAGQDNELKTLAEEESISETESYIEPISEEITETETGAITETGVQPEMLPETEPATIATTIKQIITTTKTVITTTGNLTTTTKPTTTKPTTTTTKPTTNTTQPISTTRPIRSSTTDPSAIEPETASSEVITSPARTRYGERFTFSTTDINGNPVTSADFASAKLIMINRWEPWCGPCVNELSDLQKLYTNYKDKGFVLLGVFKDNPADARTIMRQKGLTYPILNYNDQFYRFYTGSVPTTVFLDGEGYPLTSEPFIGSRPYDAWEQIVLALLG